MRVLWQSITVGICTMVYYHPQTLLHHQNSHHLCHQAPSENVALKGVKKIRRTCVPFRVHSAKNTLYIPWAIKQIEHAIPKKNEIGLTTTPTNLPISTIIQNSKRTHALHCCTVYNSTKGQRATRWAQRWTWALNTDYWQQASGGSLAQHVSSTHTNRRLHPLSVRLQQ